MTLTIYTKTQCPNCASAKQLLKSKGLEYAEISLDDADRRAQFCAEHPGVQQMPQIFFKGERIGGLAGLREWIKWKEQRK